MYPSYSSLSTDSEIYPYYHTTTEVFRADNLAVHPNSSVACGNIHSCFTEPTCHETGMEFFLCDTQRIHTNTFFRIEFSLSSKEYVL